jgi:hypothetical protein
VHGYSVSWVETEVNDIFNHFLLEENCIYFGTIIECLVGHCRLDDLPVNLDLLGFCGCKVMPKLKAWGYPLHAVH